MSSTIISGYFQKARATQFQYNVSHQLVDEENKYTRIGNLNFLSNLTLVAVGVIGILAATGILSTTAVGWSAVGLGGGAFLLQLCGGKLMKRKIDLILMAIFAAGIITLGAFGGVGLLTGAQVGYSLAGIVGAHALFYCCCCRAQAAYQNALSPLPSENSTIDSDETD